MDDDLPFKVVRSNSDDEIIARANNLLVGRAAYETARGMYPRDLIEYRNGAQVIERSDEASRPHRYPPVTNERSLNLRSCSQ